MIAKQYKHGDKFTIHAVRRIALQNIAETQGIEAARVAGGHFSSKLTIDYYVGNERDRSKLTGLDNDSFPKQIIISQNRRLGKF